MGREVEPYKERQKCTGCSPQLVCRPQVIGCFVVMPHRAGSVIAGRHSMVCMLLFAS